LLKASSCIREGRLLLVVQRLAEEVSLVAVTGQARIEKTPRARRVVSRTDVAAVVNVVTAVEK